MTPEQAYERLIRRAREWGTLASCAGLLGWDERTYMPARGADHRAEQIALLARLTHEQLTAPETGELLAALDHSEVVADPNGERSANVREVRRSYDRAVKLPKALVEELARVTTRAQSVWQEARARSDFPAFRPWLERIISLKREEAQAVGYTESPYDALLDEYEPGATSAQITSVFARLRDELVPLIQAIGESPRRPRREILEREYSVAAQEAFGRQAAAAIGFDFHAGRLDVTTHPFCSGIGPGDCRLTTRYDPRQFGQAFFGTLHEAGHGIYEQGLPAKHFGEPLGSACSLGIHESQSRTWENFVGRSRPFWEHFFPRACELFPAALADVNLDDFVFAINDVRLSFIRVESDEATYNLHIILRFELEQEMIAGTLAAADVPGAWDERFEKSFGIRPPDHARGCLQDVHWSGGAIGYFPTYTLGNMYAAQLMEAAGTRLGDLDGAFRRGDFAGLRGWLRENIHRHGQRYRPGELCRRVTGRPLDHQPFVGYLRRKFGALYGLS